MNTPVAAATTDQFWNACPCAITACLESKSGDLSLPFSDAHTLQRRYIRQQHGAGKQIGWEFQPPATLGRRTTSAMTVGLTTSF